MTPPARPTFMAPKAAKTSLPKRQFVSLSVLFLGAAIGVAGMVIAGLSLQGGGDQIEIDIQSVAVSEAGNLALVGARYSGRTETGGQFNITADEAVEGEPEAGMVTLTRPDGYVLRGDGQRMNLQASEAVYAASTSLLDLQGEVLVTESRHNIRLRTSALNASLDEGLITGKQPVEVTAPNLIIEAGGISVSQNDNLVIFTGKSKLTYQTANTASQN